MAQFVRLSCTKGDIMIVPDHQYILIVVQEGGAGEVPSLLEKK